MRTIEEFINTHREAIEGIIESERAHSMENVAKFAKLRRLTGEINATTRTLNAIASMIASGKYQNNANLLELATMLNLELNELINERNEIL